MQFDYSTFLSDITQLRDRLSDRFEVDFEHQPPAQEEDVARMEEELEIGLPTPLRKFFLTVSKKCSLDWYPEDSFIQSLPEGLQDVGSGSLFLSLEHQAIWATNWEDCRGGFESGNQYSPSRDTVYDFDTLYPFQQAENGDTLVIVKDGDHAGRVLFQSFESGPLQCARLAESFEAFISVWGQLGFPGPEEWALRPFYDRRLDCLSLALPQSVRWKEILGLSDMK